MGDEGRCRSVAEPDFWRQVVRRLGTALIVVDPTGRILAANPAAERLLGRAAAAMRGEDAHDLLHRDAAGGPVPREQCPLLRSLAERAGSRSARVSKLPGVRPRSRSYSASSPSR
ncbi:PAS domain-containing protein [Streptomyces sp. NPDC001761]